MLKGFKINCKLNTFVFGYSILDLQKIYLNEVPSRYW
jgi:hypothetical protein